MTWPDPSTEAGKIYILIGLLVWFMIIAVFLHLTGHDPGQIGVSLMENGFTAIFTALMVKLK